MLGLQSSIFFDEFVHSASVVVFIGLSAFFAAGSPLKEALYFRLLLVLALGTKVVDVVFFEVDFDGVVVRPIIERGPSD